MKIVVHFHFHSLSPYTTSNKNLLKQRILNENSTRVYTYSYFLGYGLIAFDIDS